MQNTDAKTGLQNERAQNISPRHVETAPFYVGVCQLKPRKANYDHNLNRIGELLRQIVQEHLSIDVLVLPETVMTGYFLQGGVREAAVPKNRLFQDLADAYAQLNPTHAMDICLGFYERHEGQYYNSALYATLEPEASQSQLIHLHRKFFLPTYGVFDEERYVGRGRQIDVFPTRFGPAAILICEDAWHSICATIAALKGAQVIYVPTASPARGFHEETVASVQHYRRILTRIAEEHTLYVVQSSLVGFEGGKGFIGASMIIDPMGQLVVQGPLGEEGLVIAPILPDNIALARAQSPLLADLESVIADLMIQMEEVVSR
jgi:predicted amidohydrolase